MMLSSWLFFTAAVVFALPLIARGGWPMLFVGFVSILCGYIYTGGPYPLAYHGWGDFFVLLFFGLVAVCGTYYVETGHLSARALAAGFEVGALATVLIAVNNLRDRKEDSRNHKRTLAVRFGATFVRAEIFVLCALSILSAPFLWFRQAPVAAFLPLLTLPLAALLLRNVLRTEPSRAYNSFLAQAATLHLLFGIFLSVGLIWP